MRNSFGRLLISREARVNNANDFTEYEILALVKKLIENIKTQGEAN